MKLNMKQLEALEAAIKEIRKAQLASTAEGIKASQEEYSNIQDLNDPIIDLWEQQTGKEFEYE